MPRVTFRFYAELNDFVAPERRFADGAYEAAPTETVKHAIEALGVPHTEVELIAVDGVEVGFEHGLRDGERIAVYPVFEAFDVTPLVRLRDAPLREPRFLCDAQLGGLARRLRRLGFDSRYENGADDAVVVRLALDEHRIVLSRDRELLKHRALTHGAFVRAEAPALQLAEVVRRLQLAALARPFTRCTCCNALLEPVAKSDVLAELPPKVAEVQQEFRRCPACGRLYWPGTHWERMQRELSAMLAGEAAKGPPAARPPPRRAGSPGTGSR